MSNSLFQFKEADYFRIKMIVEEGNVTGLEGHYNSGKVDNNKKES
jgi:hypothetical protein